MKNSLIFIALVLYSFSAYTQTDKGFAGHYTATRSIDSMEKAPIFFYFLGTTTVLGSDLTLKTDSSFLYRSCSTLARGKWKVKNDTLLLLVEKNRWRSDSLNRYGFSGKWPKVPEKPMKFTQIENGFQRTMPFKYNDRKLIAVETLVKDDKKTHKKSRLKKRRAQKGN